MTPAQRAALQIQMAKEGLANTENKSDPKKKSTDISEKKSRRALPSKNDSSANANECSEKVDEDDNESERDVESIVPRKLRRHSIAY
eukprot:CAMPEP_0171463374 /NCGR_PEP_ID=MMETSP0945-20130129/7072_1 /TAXON_ID=109269 /ORGANISM="Vaucheria litorea, Strain CCMP2940" /LENGTH=86 /DNA_ID=CAMNT_0011990157 /DNA_START=900 /DNA_END=1160 /DNA_ORIENTATION=+